MGTTKGTVAATPRMVGYAAAQAELTALRLARQREMYEHPVGDGSGRSAIDYSRVRALGTILRPTGILDSGPFDPGLGRFPDDGPIRRQVVDCEIDADLPPDEVTFFGQTSGNAEAVPRPPKSAFGEVGAGGNWDSVVSSFRMGFRTRLHIPDTELSVRVRIRSRLDVSLSWAEVTANPVGYASLGCESSLAVDAAGALATSPIVTLIEEDNYSGGLRFLPYTYSASHAVDVELPPGADRVIVVEEAVTGTGACVNGNVCLQGTFTWSSLAHARGGCRFVKLPNLGEPVGIGEPGEVVVGPVRG